MTEKDRINSFVTDLKAILAKHGAELGVIMEGDTHGIYNHGVDFSLGLVDIDGRRRWMDSIVLTDERGEGLLDD